MTLSVSIKKGIFPFYRMERERIKNCMTPFVNLYIMIKEKITDVTVG